MDEIIIQLIEGAKVTHNASNCYVTDTGLILAQKKDSNTWKVIHMAQIYNKNHLLSVITAPSISIRFNAKEEL